MVELRHLARRALRHARVGRPQVTAVVLLTGPEDEARAVLDAARAQPEDELEILAVVMDDGLRPLADSAAAQDWRVRPVEVDRDDFALARQLGGVAARARWLVFLSPGQLLLPGAVRALLAARGSGREPTVALGGLEAPEARVRPDEGWLRAPLLGRLLVPVGLWGRTTDDAEPDGQTAAVSLLAHRHRATDVPTLREAPGAGRGRVRGLLLEALSVRVASDRSMLATLERAPEQDARSARAAGALARDLPPFLRAVESCDESEWALLCAHAAELVEAAGVAGLETVPAEAREAAVLAAQGRRDDLTRLVTAAR
jgi:hypothetical protein